MRSVFDKTALASSAEPTSSSTRRRSSNPKITPLFRSEDQSWKGGHTGITSGLPAHSFAQPLPTIPGTPANAPPMSLSRSPSPRRDGGWATPGLTDTSGRASPRKGYANEQMNGAWAAAKAKSDQVMGYPSFSTRNEGFFSRSKRKISASLPRFNGTKDYRELEKLGRGRWYPHDGSRWSRMKTFVGNLFRRARMRSILLLTFIFGFILFYITRESCLVLWITYLALTILFPALHKTYQRTGFLGGGSKFVVILAANQGGGVMEWKGPREWAIERDSVRNKRRYVERWGYDLEIVDMSTKKRYAHEWRESWEKVDTIRNCLRKYPKAEW